MGDIKFNVLFLEEAKEFLEELDSKSREKILYNIWKSRSTNNKELFKKLNDNIWEFRTKYNNTYYRIFAFWDRSNSLETLVIASHGIIKKTSKINNKEIEKAEKIRTNYFNNK